jgi:mono/diheme cytochrome c family protein
MKRALALALVLGARDAVAEPRQVAHWLRYVAVDYPGAVRQGQVLQQEEFDEQLALLDRSLRELRAAGDREVLYKKVQELRALVEARGPEAEVGARARGLAEALLLREGLVMPAEVSLERGKAIFARACASCHGEDGSGDTALGRTLRPRPADLQDPVQGEQRSPLGVALAVEWGIPGTAMVPRADLTPGERWDVAFHVLSLGRGGAKRPTGGPDLSLQELAWMSNQELRGLVLAVGAPGAEAERWLDGYRGSLPTGPASAASQGRWALREARLLAPWDRGASAAAVGRALTATASLHREGGALPGALAALTPQASPEQLAEVELALLRAGQRRRAPPDLERWWLLPPALLLLLWLLRWRRR